MTGSKQRDLTLLGKHVILVSAPTADDGKGKVRKFFQETSLVRYDQIDIQEEVLCGLDSCFQDRLELAQQENKRLLNGFIEELAAAGCRTKQDLSRVSQGYQSKILHIVAHFLDGFIGIDSAFYNLVDDSHWLLDETAAAIAESPKDYWLFSLRGYSMTPKEAALLHN